MEVRRAVPSDAPAVAAFMRGEFLRRPEIQGDVELWTGEFALEQVERHYCVLSLEGDEVVGIVLLVGGEIVLWNRPFACDRLAVAMASGSSREQVYRLDLLLDYASQRRWRPLGVTLLDVEAPVHPLKHKWWAQLLGGSLSVGDSLVWGIVPIVVIDKRVSERLRRGNEELTWVPG